MTRLALLALVALPALAACGADGPPEPVGEAVRADASATIGVTGGF